MDAALALPRSFAERFGDDPATAPFFIVWLKDGEAAGPRDAFLGNREIGHFHPWDGSLHISLPPDLAKQAVTAGWAEVHPVARAGMAPENVVMLYGPRDEGEVGVLAALIASAVRRASGADATV